MFKKILIANRGLIAAQCVKAIQELGIPVAVAYTPTDLHSWAVRSADESYPLASDAKQPYLDGPAFVELALKIGADAVHPGYGALAHDANFAADLKAAGITPILPTVHAHIDLSSKSALKEIAKSVGFDILKGSAALYNWPELEKKALELGFPLIIKSPSGYSGRGIRSADNKNEVKNAWDHIQAQGGQLALAGLYLEEFRDQDRHIEYPVLRDKDGRCEILPPRDCSVRRRFRKMLVETPAPGIPASVQRRLESLLPTLLHQIGLVGYCSVEFLLDKQGNLRFLEVNPHIQPSHAATGALWGLDLLQEQVRLAAGEKIRETLPATHNHTFAALILALDPDQKFAPSPGRIDRFWAPSGTGVVVQSAVSSGDQLGSSDDVLLATLVVRDRTREGALRRLQVALDQFHIDGIATTLPFLRALAKHPDLALGKLTSGALFKEEDRLSLMRVVRSEHDEEIAAVIAALTLAQDSNRTAILEAAAQNQPSVWNLAARWLNRKKMEF
jgi:acetyl/propionyl-CoA carboxylase alpha subunit